MFYSLIVRRRAQQGSVGGLGYQANPWLYGTAITGFVCKVCIQIEYSYIYNRRCKLILASLLDYACFLSEGAVIIM